MRKLFCPNCRKELVYWGNTFATDWRGHKDIYRCAPCNYFSDVIIILHLTPRALDGVESSAQTEYILPENFDPPFEVAGNPHRQ